jgi:paraquat-inducible protein B
MAAKANPKIVGGFVLGAVALAVATVAVFGGGNMLAKRPRAGTYFQGSVAGLEVGAPVTYRGVRVGEVKSIRLEVDSASLSARMPVEFEFIPGAVQWTDHPLQTGDVNRLIEKGLRAKLVSQSMVTGLLAIELGNYPDTPATLIGGLPPSVLEVPSVQSDMESLKATLSSLPLERISNNLAQVLVHLDDLMTNPGWKDTLASLSAGMQDFHSVMGTVNARSTPLLDELSKTAVAADAAVGLLQGDLAKTLSEVRNLVKTMDGEVTPLSGQLQSAIMAVEKSFRQVETTLRTLDGAMDPRSPLRTNLDQTLSNLSIASKSLRSFADQIERSPNALITGR